MLDKAYESNKLNFVLGDITIDCSSNNCSLKDKLCSICETCYLEQMFTKPIRVSSNIANYIVII